MRTGRLKADQSCSGSHLQMARWETEQVMRPTVGAPRNGKPPWRVQSWHEKGRWQELDSIKEKLQGWNASEDSGFCWVRCRFTDECVSGVGFECEEVSYVPDHLASSR